ncbi:hypothetical protein PTSG_05578 [Salpingoeca rosetta]|uniref:CSN8/PSMD8/EIF3K domain-containing protein n=1 Tax=Salpingoeca rosetta (strain ATCC 50818 / BSB-021) TaxID=946362 RepID=F2UBL7_SALR5|nr:uncharacterized protein PTSG_05578 [Salpingoeca rosetta]EGD73883.1 hypothetical protein PTSG_05578 [Salpingoeca rosetta]|eukprot:XP_004993446.1 hypothetical protein PTSG_05578 [Salpingoeca rosetta]
MDEEAVRTLLAEGNIDGLVQHCTDIELDEKSSPKGVAPGNVYLVLLLAHLIQHDLSSARFLWKRIPQSVKQECPELIAAWQIGQALWKGISPRDALTAYSWNPLATALVAELKEAIVTRAFKKMTKAYATVDMDTVLRSTGMSEAECIKHATTVMQWEYDAQARAFTVKREEEGTDSKATGAATLLTDSGLAALTETVVALEA